MKLNSAIDELRKPATQVVSLFALFMILFSGIAFFYGLDYDRLPDYLKIITLIEVVIIFISLLQFFRFVNFDKSKNVNKKTLKKYAKLLTIINIIGTYNAAFAFSNVFYVMAIQNFVDLYHYWLLSTVSMIISFTFWTLGSILMFIEMPKLEQYINGKRKTFIGIGFVLLAQLLYVERIIEYFLVPNIADSKFMILGSILVLLGIYLVTFEWIRKYADFKILVLKE
ncbi:DUF5079 family protein [Staphylococcus epidermidis]|uniref:DUF5079 family protein n=1 Tax=Staphylococcus epidermidis TaxID=1282 RepID=UPI0001A96441|nr:DUF5079 family protein [Staphylococcus epidermidis]EES35679.1 hypothetical protein HMPREF0791_1712 [Staphylococcus epidermidis W23144]MBE7347667.1 DUF5079 family protein [Staphylococcus epidermidis]MBM6226224.1 DUF5079 family protein [Staphylococcus epidermidis]MBM6230842.1 DUF5079 family protein [Staphylococcus epidermidis]MBM6233134.1 DUF5079 family protein [Staphylococcus epidermidis]